MTLQTMLETIHQTFPEKQEAQVKIDLNNALALYSEETRLPFEDYDVTVVNGHFVVNNTPLVEDNGWFRLPDPINTVLTVRAYDIKDDLIDKPQYVVGYIGNQFTIMDTFHDTHFVDGVFPAGVTRLRFRCSLIPEKLVADTDTPDLPEQFQPALLDNVMARYYALKGVLQLAGWARSSYQALVTAGKRYINRNLQ